MYEMGPEEECVLQCFMLFYTNRFNAAVNVDDKSPSANFLAANLNIITLN